MDDIEYDKLYELQDSVLGIVFETEQEFYLTGGTALSRFYNAKRYSDDLDFFTNNSSRFHFAVKNIKVELLKKFSVSVELESKDFIRFMIDHKLQVDFVNDRVPRYKDVCILDNGYMIDNIENILSNKLTAVIGRDNPKDIFDIYLISKYYSFSWSDIVDSAREKASFNIEELIVRLKSFPLYLFESINLIEVDFLDNFRDDFLVIVDEIKNREFHKAIISS
jgi:hypothetical protein